jgi:hypothetical protein
MRQTSRRLTLGLAAAALVLLASSRAAAQCLVPAVVYAPAPQVSYYAPAVSYYTPAVSYYAAAPAVSYYAPAVSYYAPAVSYYAPAVYSAPQAVSRTYYGLFGRPRETVTRYYP